MKKIIRFSKNSMIGFAKMVLRWIRTIHVLRYIYILFNWKKISVDNIKLNLKSDDLYINLIGKIDKKVYKNLDIREFDNSINLVSNKWYKRTISGNQFWGFNKNKPVLFEISDKKILFISYCPTTVFKNDFKYLLKLISLRYIYKPKFTILNIQNYKNAVEWNRYKYIRKIVASMGVDYLYFSSFEKSSYGHTIKKIRYDRYTYSINNLGKLLEDDTGSFVRINLNLDNLNEINECFVPIKIIDKKIKSIHNTKGLNKNIVSYYKTKYWSLHTKETLILFEDLFKILNIEIPEKYRKYKKMGINKICSKFSEVSPGDVLFLLEPYKYNNDKTTASKFDRVEQAHRAIIKGAFFVFSYFDFKTIQSLVLENVRESHIKVCENIYLKNASICTIAVTGSVGKTTTKDMLAEVFSQKYNVLRSPSNGNLQIKIGYNIQNILPNTDVYIQEIGGGRPGGASRHSRMILPDMAVVTNVGTAHLGNFKDQDDLAINKLGITDGLKPGGLFFLNLDDECLSRNINYVKRNKVITYSLNKKNADYYASNINEYGNYTTFYINYRKTKIFAKINVGGLHNVLNAVLCFAMAYEKGIETDFILKGLEEYKTSGIRQNLIHLANRNLFVDCFNASIDSVKTSLQTFNSFNIPIGSKKIVVLGDLTGIGDAVEDVHLEISKELQKYKFDIVVLIGDSIKITYLDLLKKGIKVMYFPLKQKKKVKNFLINSIKENDYAMFKGSSKVELEYNLDVIYGANLGGPRLNDEGEFAIVKFNKSKYYLYKNYAILSKFKRKQKKVHIRNVILGKKNYGVDKKCFYNCKRLEKVFFSKNNIHIGNMAFSKCFNLNFVKFNNIKFIGSNAFNSCVSLKNIILNEGVLQISKNAFSYCVNLEKIYIPNSVVQIDKDAFLGDNKLVIFCYKNSCAEKYAIENKINFEIIGDKKRI